MNKQVDKEKLDIAGAQLVPIMKEQINMGRTVRFKPRGTSMLPLIRQGRDSVTLEKINRPLKRNDIVFYQRDNGQFVLHRIVRIGDTITCSGDNEYTFEKNLRHDQMFAVVCKFSRDDKEYSVNCLPYRLYYNYIYIFRPLRHFIYAIRRKFGLTK